MFPPVVFAILCIGVFAVGCSVGSFINVVRVRGSWLSALHGRSRCDSCRRSLVWYEVVPVFSYVLLRGRCRACLARIAPSHAAAEVFMGVLFITSFIHADSLAVFGAGVLAATFLVPIVLSDIERMEVPEHLSLPFAYGAFVFAAVLVFQTGSIMPVVTGLALAAPFFAVWFFSGGRAMGLGDAKVALPLGFLLPTLLSAVSVAVFSFWLSTIAVLCYVLYMKIRVGSWGLTRRMHVPLVPGIAAGYFLVYYTDLSFLAVAMWV